MACALPDRERKPEPALNRGALFPSDFVTSTLQIGYKYIKIYLCSPVISSMHMGGISHMTFLRLRELTGKSSPTFLCLLSRKPALAFQN